MKIILLITVILPLAILPFLAAAQDYQLLEPEFLPGNQRTVSDFGQYAGLAFRSVLMVVVVLAILMLTLSGLQYITSQAGGSKEEAKKRATAAIIGLLIALSSYIILKQINPNLVGSSLNLENLGSRIINGTGLGTNIRPGTNLGGGGGIISDTHLSGPRREDETNAQAILRNAQYAADNNVSTCGRRACAGAVNDITYAATGDYVGGGLSTANMYSALLSNSNFQLVSGGITDAQPGDIIISPTQGNNTGHVGICETTGCGTIISNSSNQVRVARNFTASSWVNSYSNLGVYIFRPL